MLNKKILIGKIQKLEIRINVRNNPIYLNCLQYDNNGKTIPNGNEDENDIRYILETTENIPSIIKNYSPEKNGRKTKSLATIKQL